MKQIALSIEQMKHLEELGLDTMDASLCWVNDDGDIYLDMADEYDLFSNDITPAYTLQDILEKIPDMPGTLALFRCLNFWECSWYIDGTESYTKNEKYGSTALEAAYNMLCWCIENGYIKTK